MKILTNRKIRTLFIRISLYMLTCTLCFMALIILGQGSILEWKRIVLGWESTAIYTLIYVLVMGIAVLTVCYKYFKEQNRIMEDAVTRIREYISGDWDARIECDEEGELYRLFHEVNSLAAILNAKAEKEGKSKEFLQNTISDISHQLKTPLAALNVYNGIIQAEAETEKVPTIREFSNLSEQELDRMETLVQNLLKITKFDTGTIMIEKNMENVAEMMEDVKKYFSYRAGCEGKEIVLSGNESLSFLCDRNWIVEAVSNIVKNALDHMAGGDSVLIEWGESASVIRIKVKDNGSGIHPEDLYHIFKRFYRSRFSKDTQGIGLGLPLAKAVAEAHNGTVEVDSRFGEGTTFVMNFLQSGHTTKL